MARRRLAATVAVLLVAVAPGLVGCGDNGGGGGEVEIIIGFEGDWTGPAASGSAEYGGGFLDYIKWTNEENPIPGVKLTVKSYDTRSDYSRTPVGYAWLKGQGMDVFVAPSPADLDINYDNLKQDQIPGFGTTSLVEIRNATWAFWVYDTFEAQSEFCMDWIATTDWDYTTGTNPKVAFVGWSGLITSEASLDGTEMYIEAHSDKFDWQGAHMAPTGNVSWSSEAQKLVDCDYIVLGTIGAGTASFIRESRNRGFTGDIVSNTSPLTGWWNLITASVEADQLYGQVTYHQMPWWFENPFTEMCRTIGLMYHSQEWIDTAFKQSSYCMGPAWGEMVVTSIRQAAENVGAENVDSQAIRDAAETLYLDMTGDGWPIPWQLSPDNHVVCDTTAILITWNVSTQKWDTLTDWYAYP